MSENQEKSASFHSEAFKHCFIESSRTKLRQQQQLYVIPSLLASFIIDCIWKMANDISVHTSEVWKELHASLAAQYKLF